MEATAGVRRLSKSRKNKMLDGVCGGIAEYFAIDATIVRLLFVLLLLAGGLGGVLYLIGMILMPGAAAEEGEGAQPVQQPPNTFWGVLLIVAGAFWLMGNLGLRTWQHWWHVSWGGVLGLLLLGAGVALLASAPARRAAGGATPTGAEQPPPIPGKVRLYRSRYDRKLAGVCGGLGSYFAIDPVIVRILFVLAGLASLGIVVVLYVILALLTPKEPLLVQQ